MNPNGPPPFTIATLPGGLVPIPQHIRAFLDRTHQPTQGGYVYKEQIDVRDFYYRIRRLSPVKHPVSQRILSAYNRFGQLKPYIRFDGHEFDEYIFHASRSRRLMFRVENRPARLNYYRYPQGCATAHLDCRFAKCPTKVIRPGHVQVAISEFSDPQSVVLDPYRNVVGYVHLFCLEQFCNLPSLLAETDVTFIPAIELAKEAAFPGVLNVFQRHTVTQWAEQARESWREFKSRFPTPETRPLYYPQEPDRLYYRLAQVQKQVKYDPRMYAGFSGQQNGGYQHHAPPPQYNPRPASPGQALSALAQSALRPGEYAKAFANFCEAELASDVASPKPATPIAAGPKATIHTPVVEAARQRLSRRLSAPGVLGVQNAGIVKRPQLCRSKDSKVRDVLVTESDLARREDRR